MQCRVPVTAPLRRTDAQVTEQLAECAGRQRRVLSNDYIDQRVERGLRIGLRGCGLTGCVQTNTALAPRDPEKAAVMQATEQLRRRVR